MILLWIGDYAIIRSTRNPRAVLACHRRNHCVTRGESFYTYHYYCGATRCACSATFLIRWWQSEQRAFRRAVAWARTQQAIGSCLAEEVERVKREIEVDNIIRGL